MGVPCCVRDDDGVLVRGRETLAQHGTPPPTPPHFQPTKMERGEWKGMEKILTGSDRAKELGFKSYREWLSTMSRQTGHTWDGKTWSTSAVYARVDFGRWIADCEMGHASYVEPSDDLFWCYMCGNAPANGAARHVIFPQNRKEIEQELLRREVKLAVSLPKSLLGQATQVAMNSRGKDNPMLGRSWKPGETVESLRAERLGDPTPSPSPFSKIENGEGGGRE